MDEELYVDFSTPVSGFSFAVCADDAVGPMGTVRVFQNGAYTASVSMIGDGNHFTAQTVDLSAYPGVTRIEIVDITDPAGLWYDDFKFNPPPKITLAPYRAGDNFGAALSEAVKQSGDPSQYVILTNNNYDEHPDQSAKDYDDNTAQIGTDQDLAKITLDKLPSDLTTGTIELATSNPSAVRLFQDDGTELTQTTLDLSNPSGYLAGLTSGDVNVWVEGLQADPDLIFKLGYKDSSGTEVSRDTVHVCVADWTFVDKAGDTVTSVEKDSEQLLLDQLTGDPLAPQAADDVFFKSQIDGLSPDAVDSLSMTSDSTSSSTFSDTLIGTSGGVESAEYAALYTPPDGMDDLTPDQVAQIQSQDGVNVVHNPDATGTLKTKSDSFTRAVAGKDQTSIQHLYEILTSDAGYGDKVKFVLDRMDWNNDGRTFTRRIVFQPMRDPREYQIGDDGTIYLKPGGTDDELKARALNSLRGWAYHGVIGLVTTKVVGRGGVTVSLPPPYFASIARQWARHYYWTVDNGVPIDETFTGHPHIAAYIGQVDPSLSGDEDAARRSLVGTLDFLYFFSGVYGPTATGSSGYNLPDIYLWVFSDRTSILPNSHQHAHFAVNIPARLGLDSDYWEASSMSFHDVPSQIVTRTDGLQQVTWPDEDQLHHFAGYFWLGMFVKDNPLAKVLWELKNGPILINALKTTGDADGQNPGDYNLGLVAYDLGKLYQSSPGYSTSTIVWNELGMTAAAANSANGRTDLS